MRRTAGTTIVVLVIVVAGLASLWLAYRDRPTPAARPTAIPSARPNATPAPQPAGVPARPKDAQRMKVTYVYDGDTLQLQAAKPGRYVTTVNKVKVRLIGVDSPEMTPTQQCYAQQATDRLKVVAKPGSTVWVAPDKDSWDDYKRRLFLVWTDSGTLVEHDLIRGGYGRALRIYPNITYWPLYEQTQARAQKAKRGLWGAC